MTAVYIAFEGIDGSGKTKQLTLLSDYLVKADNKILLTKEFGSSHDLACAKIREFALNGNYKFDELAGQFMFAACSSQHSVKVIEPNLSSYDFILSDRSVESNLAYCSAIGFDKKLTHTLFFLDQRRTYPDIIIYLDIDPDLAWSRLNRREKEVFSEGGEDRIESKGLSFQHKVRTEYLRRIEENDRYLVIDCNLDSIDQVHKKIINQLTERLMCLRTNTK